MRERTAPPRTSLPVDATWLRIGKYDWCESQATVHAVEWKANQGNNSVGHFRVDYTYKVRDERYVGKFVDFASADEDYLRAGDEILIRYNPLNPSKSYYPAARIQSNFQLVCLIVGAAIGCIVILIALLTGLWK